ncbi:MULTISPECIES: Mov34/MPN/PAD-1 family protein [unclassified Mesorhizobium]|uniref:Mov34/MPN/PAD-1 family protein n=1 Tax=unclassified Mesorhizobium TaxID=325217 RepID=UPI001FEE873A|nr:MULTISPECIES: Mov34/MPN/PAD-1 family protein [unclassified Mesorhizobium]
MHKHLATVGQAGYEGLGLWVGKTAGETATVERALIPQQRLIRTASGVGVRIEGDELHRLNVWLFENKLRILAQVHSHPTDAYHSGTDDENAIATAIGSLSLVVPDFASRPFDLSSTAVYRLNAAGSWLEVPRQAAVRLIEIED